MEHDKKCEFPASELEILFEETIKYFSAAVMQ